MSFWDFPPARPPPLALDDLRKRASAAGYHRGGPCKIEWFRNDCELEATAQRRLQTTHHDTLANDKQKQGRTNERLQSSGAQAGINISLDRCAYFGV